jgi:hypothetical protein
MSPLLGRIVLGVAVAMAAALVGACTYYVSEPGYVSGLPPPAASFDRSWSAVLAAFGDQGVPISTADRAAGVVRGSRDGINVTANVRSQTDGSVRVEFNTSGSTTRDPGLIDRISRAYDQRMGR